MMKPSFTLVISGIFTAYILHSIWSIYQLYNPSPCPSTERCIKASWKESSKFQLIACTSTKTHMRSESDLKEVWKSENFDIFTSQNVDLNITLPKQTLHNGSLYLHIFLTHIYGSPKDLQSVFQDPVLTSYEGAPLTKYVIPRMEVISLLTKQGTVVSSKNERINDDKPATHWKPQLSIHVMSEPLALFMKGIPGEISPYLKLNNRKEYLPIVYISELGFRMKDLVTVNSSNPIMPLTIAYSPISFGRLRLMVMVEHSMKMLEQMGFTEKDTDEVKGIFFDTSIYLLLLTFFVSAFHLLFDILAFKNDINFWRRRKTMIGLSFRALVWRCVSQGIVFLYLFDQETSLLVLIPAGIAAVIEFWKVTKALKLRVEWQGWRPKFEFGASSAEEKETDAYDSQSMKYLSYVLYPLCLGGAVYSLLYVQHKSWYSWCVQSLVNGVYAFGFIFMLPQLFVNYKLKSVAHLPWRAFMYKAFNTFIDDLFAFIITMPTAHRVACFRDDIVFVIYLYQRWLYPVDKSRVNEYGESYEKTDGKSKKE